MKMLSMAQAGAVLPQLKGTARDEIIVELVDALVSVGAVDGSLRDTVYNAVLERESRGSTGFGRGVAVPHVKHADVSGITIAVGLSQDGVDFNALDKQPVHSVFLLLSPEGQPEMHLKAMETVFKNLSQETFRKLLRQAQTAEAVHTLLEEADSGAFLS